MRSSLRACVSISASACSAQAMLARRRMFSTATPRSAQAAVSMVPSPRPYFCTNFSFGAAASSSRPKVSASTATPRASASAPRNSSWVSTICTRAGNRPGDFGAHARAVVVEVGLMREEIGEGGVALGRRVRIEHDLEHAQERIVFDDKEGRVRHGVAQG